MTKKTYPIPKEYKKLADDVLDEVEAANWAYHRAIMYGRRAQKRLWNLVHEIYPELKEVEVSYDHAKQLIVVEEAEVEDAAPK